MKQLIVGTAAGNAKLDQAAAKLAELVAEASEQLSANFAALAAEQPGRLTTVGERTATHQTALDVGQYGATVFITVLVTATADLTGQLLRGDDEA